MRLSTSAISIILIIAAFFRLPFLNSHMPSLYGDEIAIGYNAFSIVKTGRDEFGRFLPLQFQSWGDQKNPIYIYAVALTQLITGPTPASVRLPSAVAGIFAVYLTYRLVLLLNLSRTVALISAFLLTVTPWHLHLSRGGYEANLALTFGLASVVALLSKKHFISALYLALGAYTYYTTKLFLPALLLSVWIYLNWGTPIKKWVYSFIKYWLLVVVLALPALYLMLFQNGQARFNAINIFKNPLVVNQVERGRNFFDNNHSPLAKITENRWVYHFQEFVGYYFDNFSGQFLFVGGDSNVRYGLANHGMLYLLDAPIILAGLFLLYAKNRRAFTFLVVWLLLAPLPTSLVGKAYGLRSLVMLPIPQIFAGYALSTWFVSHKKSFLLRIGITIFLILYLLSISNWLFRYIYQYPSYGRYWYDSPMKEAIDYAKERENQYDQIIITQHYGETSMYFAFYNQIDPKVYKAAKENKLTVDGVPMIKIGKYYFGDIRPKGSIEKMDLPRNTLILVQPYFEYSEGTIKARDDGRPIFQVFGFPTVHMKEKNGSN